MPLLLAMEEYVKLSNMSKLSRCDNVDIRR